ncbi:M48 family metalloprotease [Desulforhopalus vacuolatus]|uniref:beta-barrel assembly-enhancing protease n=1 Tax=Desulforhopalus vacuolatus TaxID=40414 RepID=UPI001963ADC3|nr:M48 family metalloprotease [Desulforhopalus vacuolatus]MBM9519045.1 M48 family metalloprotease [Desulforhopalus vacuolatus]
MAQGSLSLKKTVATLCTVALLSGSALPAASFSIKEEREVGEKLVYQVRQAFPLLEEPDISQYITSLGDDVLSVAGIQYFKYHFYVIKSSEFNAFSAPSGMIFFYSGLITKMESENELVAVLAHEIGHSVKRHIASGQKEGAYSTGAALALAILGIAVGGDAAPALITGALATGQTVNLHYSRVHEQEADALAYHWLCKMKRNPQAEVQMLAIMRRIARYRSEKLPQYLLTHPNPEERMNTVASFIDSDGIPEDTRVIDNFAFLRFKYRLLVLTEDPDTLRNYFGNRLARRDATEQTRAMATYGLARLACEEMNFDNALKLIDEVITVYPRKRILKVDKGVILTEAGKLNEALPLLEKVHRDDAASLYASWALGRLYQQMGRVQDALHCYKEVQRVNPGYPKLLFEMGQIEARQGNNGIANYYLASSQLYAGNMKMAKASLNRALGDTSMPKAFKKRCFDLQEKIKDLEK